MNDSDLRSAAESALLGSNFEEYGKIPARVKPKYAFLAPKKGTESEKLASSRSVWSYGADRWTFKLARVSNRTSLFAGDSLNSIMPYINAQTHKTDRIDDSTHWFLRYIPWSRRQMLTPFLGEAMAPTSKKGKTAQLGSTLGLRVNTFTMTEKQASEQGLLGGMMTTCGAQPTRNNHWDTNIEMAFLSCSRLEPTVPGFEHYAKGLNYSMDYIEAQIWGPLTIDDVESVAFDNSEPNPEILAELKARGISVRDVRNPCLREKRGVCMQKTRCLEIGKGPKSDYSIREWQQMYEQSGANLSRIYGNKKLSWSAEGCDEPSPIGCCY